MLRFKLSYSNASHYSSYANMKYLEINGIDEMDIREFMNNLISILNNIDKPMVTIIQQKRQDLFRKFMKHYQWRTKEQVLDELKTEVSKLRNYSTAEDLYGRIY
jgi:hypothetical protein